MDRSRWWEWAACQGVPLQVFFPTPGSPSLGDPAKRICARCPVRVECLEDQLGWERVYARGGHLVGVFGGVSAAVRDGWLKAERAARRGGVAA